MPRASIIVLILLAAVPVRPGLGATEPPVKLDAAVGFDGVYRAGAWTPVYLTLASQTPRAVIIELNAPHDGSNAMRISLLASASPTPGTLLMIAPLPSDLSLAIVTVRDASSRRALADLPLDQATASIGGRRFGSDLGDVLIGHAGGDGTRQPSIDLGTLDAGRSLVTGSIPPSHLPTSPIGYDCLDLLVLGAVDLARMDPSAGRAIADWVYAGGTLLVWPGTAPLPAGSPIVELLPADVGENVFVQVPPDLRRTFSLPDRFEKLPARQLTPRPGASSLDPLGPAARGHWIDRGLGRVAILPFDPTLIPLNDSDHRRRFWTPVLGALLGELRVAQGSDRTRMLHYTLGFAQGNAINLGINQIGDIPGIGQFGFSYILVVLLGLMLVVGPVDWLLLKRIGRQPWTIYTTAGWIALVTLVALYAGSLVRSGDLHLRSLELIDQADGRVVARSHLVVVYSPQTAVYELAPAAGSWWRPASAQSGHYTGGGIKTDLPFAQTPDGTPPAAMRIPVWSVRFLRGIEYPNDPSDKWIDAELRAESIDGQNWLVGTVRNVGPATLQGITFSTRDGSASLPNLLAAGASATVRVRLAGSNASSLAGPPVNPPAAAAEPVLDGAASTAAGFMAINWTQHQRHRQRAYEAAGPHAWVTLVAETDVEAASPLSIRDRDPKVEHRRVIRASLPLVSETPR